MAALIISQSVCQPQQAVAAVSFLSNLINGTRGHATSAHRDSKVRQKKVIIHNKNEEEKHEAIQRAKFEPLDVQELSLLLRDVQISCPLLAPYNSSHTRHGKWVESHTSAATFFENKAGFPVSHTLLPHTPIPTLQAAVNDPLFRRLLRSVVHSHCQTRGFKTRRSQEPSTGFGSKHDQRSESLDPRSEWVSNRSESNDLGRRYDQRSLSVKDRLYSHFLQTPVAQQRMQEFIDQIERVKRINQGGRRDSRRSETADSPTPRQATNTDLFSKGRPPPAVDSDSITKAFTEGYKASEAKDKKGRWGRWLKNILIGGFILWYAGLLPSVSISTSSTVKGFEVGFGASGEQYDDQSDLKDITFDDVRGAYEAKEELSDIVNFLRNPDKYTSLGANLPKGVLLVGPPGVGKTLLARAVAGEAKVPFFQASGSEFDEMYVGVGAKRVRELFEKAKAAAPCIIFIDEFDSVGSKRSNSTINPYANQTVNQLLNEMDGFKQNEGIVVMASTNMPDNLDKALRRPGRFDVEVSVSLPDLKARQDILSLYVGKITKDLDVDVAKLAKGTTGFSGAELANLVNQAALKAVIEGHDTVNMAHFDFARDKIIMGPAKKHNFPDEETNKNTAFHEAGHTLVAYLTKDATPLHKVTILARGQSLGHTSFMDDKEILQRTFSSLKAQLDVGMGGRVAEELIFGKEKITTGASSDLEQTTRIATSMVTRVGMSDKVGLRVFGQDMNGDLSPDQMEKIDSEIKRLLQESYERVMVLLRQHNKELTNLAEALLQHETLDKEQIKAVVEGKKLK